MLATKMPWKKHRLAPPIPILQPISPVDSRSMYIFQSDKDFYLGDVASNDIYRVSESMGIGSIIRTLKDPSQRLGLGGTDGPRNL